MFMGAIAHRTRRTRLADVRAHRAWAARTRDSAALKLVPDDGGWSLVRLNGDLVFKAAGAYGRQACLTFAYAEGVPTVLS
jgi:hypothetical protein